MGNRTLELMAVVEDERLPASERRDALRLICSIRGESSAGIHQVPEADLGAVVWGMLVWEKIGLSKGLSFKDSVEAVVSGRAQRGMGT